MSIKTTDGYVIERGSYYYLESGQQIVVYDAMCHEDKSISYLVAPFYEGEAISVECVNGSHHEYCTPYTIEGEKTLVSNIFTAAPSEKIDEQIVEKHKELTRLLHAVAVSKAEQNEMASETIRIACEVDKNQLALTEITKLLGDELQKLVSTRITLSEIRDITPQQIVGESVTVGKSELAELNKVAFYAQCLDEGGVDNWAGFTEALEPFYERYPTE